VAVLVLAGAIVIPRLDRTDRTDRPTAADGISAVTETGQTDPGEVDTEETDAGQGGTGQSGTGQSGGEAAPTDGTAPVGGPQPGWTQGEAAGGAAPTGAGIVSLAADATDSRTLEVARMFDTYFSGINDKDYDTVGSVLDPAGPVDPGNAREMAALARGTRSTRDSEVALTALADLGDSRLRAEVTFRSDQDPGDGPKGRTAETCTRWDIDYTLSSAGGTYRILRGEATSQPC
jgi:hypothetical protein